MPMLRRSLLAALPAMIITLAFSVLFIDKAFTVDDSSFLFLARHMIEDPIHYASFDLVFYGMQIRASTGVAGPVMPALLVPAVLAGGAEWLAHLAMLPVFAIGLVSCASLALRLGVSAGGACWVALLVGTSPAVLALATTSMPDVPAMSFGALAAERLLAFKADRRVLTGICAAVVLALAVLSRPHLAALFVCLVPLLLDEWPVSLSALRNCIFSRALIVELLPIAGAVALLGIVTFVTRDPLTSGNLAGATKQSVELWPLKVNVSNLPAQWMLSFPLGLAWVLLHGRRMVTSLRCWAWAAVGAWLAALAPTVTDHWRLLLWQAPITALGMAVLADIITDAWRRHDLIEIGLAAWLLIAWPAAVYAHLPPKYLVPCAPAMAILIVRHATSTWHPLFTGGTLAIGVIVGLILGFLIAHADANSAEAGRIGGHVIADKIKRGERVWYDGGVGFAWYAAQAGARPITMDPPLPAPGDVVVRGPASDRIGRCPEEKLLRKIEFNEPGGRIRGNLADFYTGWYGTGPMLPWQWSSNSTYESIEVWHVENCDVPQLKCLLGCPKTR